MIFKGSSPIDKLKYFIERYLGSRTRLRPNNSSVDVIFNKMTIQFFLIIEIFQ